MWNDLTVDVLGTNFEHEASESGSITPTTVGDFSLVDFSAEIDTFKNELKQMHQPYKHALTNTRLVKDQEKQDLENLILLIQGVIDNQNTSQGIRQKLQDEHRKLQDKFGKLTTEVTEVTRLGQWINDIQDFSSLVDSSVRSDDVTFKRTYQEGIRSEARNAMLSDNLASVERYGIDVEQMTFISCVLENNHLLEIERFVFKKAIEELMSGNSDVALVDFFVGRKEGYMGITDRDLPETHTVVLWNSGNGGITLIDPSVGKFSNFLINSGLLGVISAEVDPNSNINFIAMLGDNDSFYATSGEKAARSNYTDSSPNPRDCIDIAVKIAFEIIDQTHLENPDIEGRIKEISNSRDVNNVFVRKAKQFDKSFLRGLQSSNFMVRAATKNFLSFIKG